MASSSTEPRKGRSTFFKVRVSILLAVLVAVLLYAGGNVLSRRARKQWKRPLNVAIVLVKIGSVDDGALAMVRKKLPLLEGHLETELHRFRATPTRPFFFVAHGPIAETNAPPHLSDLGGDGLIDLAKHTWRRRGYLKRIDQAGGVDTSAYDSVVYLVVRPPAHDRQWFVEGDSEQGGRVGVIEVELDAASVDLALFVATHELLHTLDATDKYDASGATMLPKGLAEPDLVPQLPQKYVEVMARTRPLEDGREKSLEALSDLRVGPWTASEIGWSAPR